MPNAANDAAICDRATSSFVSLRDLRQGAGHAGGSGVGAHVVVWTQAEDNLRVHVAAAQPVRE